MRRICCTSVAPIRCRPILVNNHLQHHNENTLKSGIAPSVRLLQPYRGVYDHGRSGERYSSGPWSSASTSTKAIWLLGIGGVIGVVAYYNRRYE
jgi:hypothetical protein